MLRSVLIANRGEIARRVIRTCRRLGVRTIAVYSDADRDAPHVREADEARRVGPAEAAASYLNVPAVLAAARASGAEAVHPGYGFLSENAGFARACAGAGLVFVGPAPEAIEVMGAKDRAKAAVASAGVPLVPGEAPEPDDPDALRAAAGRIGYPVLLKAAAGGGGRGMRVVRGPGDFDDALAGARREARAAFGDGRMLVERLIERPRHVEVQVFGDSHGALVHLFERDCSLQRRHQKVVEEAPAPGLDAALRRALGEAAVASARTVAYAGAGTVEFLLDPEGRFHFIEMNTRLQVEHPATEMITGLDLVEWQLRVASGEPLPLTQEAIGFRGHAVEARLCAEDPAAGFLPAAGRLTRFRPPPGTADLRIEAGVAEGDRVTPHYDPMIAKLIAHGPDRAAALRRLGAALAATEVAGPATNRAFLARLVADPAVAAGAVDTGFLDREAGRLTAPEASSPAAADDDAALAVACLLHDLREAARQAAAASADPSSPWHRVDGWRAGGRAPVSFVLRSDAAPEDGAPTTVDALAEGDRWRLARPGGGAAVLRVAAAPGGDGRLSVELDGRTRAVTYVRDSAGIVVFADGRARRFAVGDAAAGDREEAVVDRLVTAPMPGRVVRLAVAVGESVARGHTLVVLEAMKMEHGLTAPADGRITEVACAEGEPVEEGRVLLRFEPAGASDAGAADRPGGEGRA